MNIDLRNKIYDLIEQWENEIFDELQVLVEAEGLLEENSYLYDYVEKEDHPNYILYQVLDFLEKLHWYLVTKEDIPVILKYLCTPQGKEKEASADWFKYWDNIDYKKRKKELKGHPYYVVNDIEK